MVEGRIAAVLIRFGLMMETMEPVSMRNFCLESLKTAAISMKRSTPVHAPTTLEVFSLTLGVLALMVLKKHRLSDAFDQATYTMVCIVLRIVRRTRGIDKFLSFVRH